MVQPQAPGQADPALREEFVELARSAGAEVRLAVDARVERPSASHYLGSGKVEELRGQVAALEASVVLINAALSPVQERNLEKDLGCRVVDRIGLILDIFAQRAATHEGKLQVELAQLQHQASRLVGRRGGLDSQRGGAIGLRGPGETALETDRRLIRARIDALKHKLERIEVQRKQMRRARVRQGLPRVALVGYTNAGKSTLFNALTGSAVLAADQLFATLDPTVRRLAGSPGAGILLGDTVGFVRDLPHDLVAAFRSTLAEAREADLLLHVVDAGDPQREAHVAAVEGVLAEIGAGDLPQWRVFNKIDRLADPRPRHDDSADGQRRFWLSARDGTGVLALRDALVAHFAQHFLDGELTLAPADGRLRARLHAAGAVIAETPEPQGGWRVRLRLPWAEAEGIAAEAGGHPLHALLLEGPVAPT